MKKSLIAVAALAAVSAASAQSSVTLYGVIDIGYASQKTESRNGTQVKSVGLTDGTLAGNRIGFRGTEDLGGGLKANFVIEQGFSPTSGSALAQRFGSAGNAGLTAAGAPTFTNQAGAIPGGQSGFTTSTNRQSYVGLSSASMGTVNIGYQYTNLYELGTLSGYNVGSEGTAGSFVHTYLQEFLGGTRANGVTYVSPDFGGGFTVRAQYGASGRALGGAALGGTIAGQDKVNGTANGANFENAGRRYSLMGQYKNGPLSAAIAYTSLRSTASGVAAAAALGGTGSQTNNLTQLGASYDFGVAKLSGTYNYGKVGAIGVNPDANGRAYQVGVAVPFGAIVPFISYGRGRADQGGSRVQDIKQSQVGVRYSMSKRTTAYAIYGVTKDDGSAASVVAPVASGGIVSRDSKAVFGVNHSF